MSRRRKLGRTAVAAIVGLEIVAAIAVALWSHGGHWGGVQPTRGRSSAIFEQAVSGPLSAPSLAVF